MNCWDSQGHLGGEGHSTSNSKNELVKIVIHSVSVCAHVRVARSFAYFPSSLLNSWDFELVNCWDSMCAQTICGLNFRSFHSSGNHPQKNLIMNIWVKVLHNC